MSKITKISLEEMLLLVWQQGWPEYVVNPSDDYPAIRSVVNKVVHHLNDGKEESKRVDPATPEGRERISNAIVNIAKYCRINNPYASKNLHFINRAFQTLYNEMLAKKRLERIKSQDYNWKK